MILTILFQASAMITIFTSFTALTYRMLDKDIPPHKRDGFPTSVPIYNHTNPHTLEFDGSIGCWDKKGSWESSSMQFVRRQINVTECFNDNHFSQSFPFTPPCNPRSTRDGLGFYKHGHLLEEAFIVGAGGIVFIILLITLHDIFAFFQVSRAKKIIRNVLFVSTTILILFYAVFVGIVGSGIDLFTELDWTLLDDKYMEDSDCSCFCSIGHDNLNLVLLFGYLHGILWKVFMIMRMQKDSYVYSERMYTVSYPIPVECANKRVTEGNMWSLVNIEELEDNENNLSPISRNPKKKESKCCSGLGDWRIAAFRIFYSTMIILYLLTIYNVAIFVMFMSDRISTERFYSEMQDNKHVVVWFTIIFTVWTWSVAMIGVISIQLLGFDFGSSFIMSILESLLVYHVLNIAKNPSWYDIYGEMEKEQFPKSFMWPALIIFVITCCLTTFFCVEFRRFCKFRFPHFYKYIRRMHARDKPFEMIIFHSTLAIPWCYSYMCKNQEDDISEFHLSSIDLRSNDSYSSDDEVCCHLLHVCLQICKKQQDVSTLDDALSTEELDSLTPPLSDCKKQQDVSTPDDAPSTIELGSSTLPSSDCKKQQDLSTPDDAPSTIELDLCTLPSSGNSSFPLINSIE